jgi:hypothetical protein
MTQAGDRAGRCSWPHSPLLKVRILSGAWPANGTFWASEKLPLSQLPNLTSVYSLYPRMRGGTIADQQPTTEN